MSTFRGGASAPRVPHLGEDWSESERSDLLDAFTGARFFHHRNSTEVWGIRQNVDGRLEIAVTRRADAPRFQIVADLDTSGNLRIDGALTQNFVFPAPGR